MDFSGVDIVDRVYRTLAIPVQSPTSALTGPLAHYLEGLLLLTAEVRAVPTKNAKSRISKVFRFLAHLGVPLETIVARVPLVQHVLGEDG